MKHLFVILFFLTAHLSYAQNKWNWASSAPSGEMVYGSNGDILLTGTYQKSALVGSYTIDSPGSTGCFVASINRSGDVNWLKKTTSINGGGWVRSNCICTDLILVGQNIDRMRKERKLTVDKLAEAAGI